MIFGTGRQPNTDQLGLENTKVALDEKGYVKVDKFKIPRKMVSTQSAMSLGKST